MQVIGMHIGSSFAEICFLQSNNKGQLVPMNEPTYLYLPRQSLRTQLPKLLQAHPSFKPEKAFITSQFLERLFDFRLGGSTAQLVTAGCETWPFLGASAVSRGWIDPVKSQPIASGELSFAVEERILPSGEVRTPLDLKQLEEIATKLKAQQIKRVCIHFLHAAINPMHQNAAAQMMREQGFDVFVPSESADLSEGIRWRRSTLEASFSGTFDELRSEIEKGFEGTLSPEQILFRDHRRPQSGPETSRVGTLFGLDECLLAQSSGAPSVVDLGLESWRLILRKDQKSWTSPWGCLEAKSQATRMDLRCQPTSIVERTGHGEVLIQPRKEGFEPGPLSFGRGQKLLVFDLFSSDLQDHPCLKDQMPATGIAKRDSFLNTLCRNSRLNDPEKLLKQLRADVLDAIAWDLNVHLIDGPLVIHGFFASLLGPEIKKRLGDRPVSFQTKTSAEVGAQASRDALT